MWVTVNDGWARARRWPARHCGKLLSVWSSARLGPEMPPYVIRGRGPRRRVSSMAPVLSRAIESGRVFADRP